MNSNIIISLAYIRVNENPLQVFCNMIEYALHLSSADASLRIDELRKTIEKKFGLMLPHHLITTCSRMMESDGVVIPLENGRGYQLINGKFDVDFVDSELRELKEKERILLEDLVEYTGKLGQKWNEEDSREYLTQFLLKNNAAYNLFLGQYRDTDSDENEEVFVSPDYYVKGYINQLLDKEESSNYGYLIDVVSGLMLYIGVSYTEDYSSAKNESFIGTRFFLDTNLLLRVLGYSLIANVEAAKELIAEIQNVNGGEICVFEHNAREVENALSTAADDLRYRSYVSNYELRMFGTTNKFTEDDFKTSSRGARKTIEDVYKYKIVPSDGFYSQKNHKYNLDWEKIVDHIQKQQPKWNQRSIENDVDAVSYINIIRKGDYSVNFGGHKKLPIFVTTN